MYVQGGIGAWYDPLADLYKRAKKLQPGQILARELGVQPGSQVAVVPPPGAPAPQQRTDWKKIALYAGGAFVAAKALKVI